MTKRPNSYIVVNGELRVWAIRKKDTDLYLPYNEKRRGYSQDEPIHISIKPPRIHYTLRAAQNTLIAWRQGEFVLRYSPGDYGMGESYTEPKKLPHRDAIQMEIVQLKIKLPNYANLE